MGLLSKLTIRTKAFLPLHVQIAIEKCVFRIARPCYARLPYIDSSIAIGRHHRAFCFSLKDNLSPKSVV